jgi:hypothetical protein
VVLEATASRKLAVSAAVFMVRVPGLGRASADIVA